MYGIFQKQKKVQQIIICFAVKVNFENIYGKENATLSLSRNYNQKKKMIDI